MSSYPDTEDFNAVSATTADGDEPSQVSDKDTSPTRAQSASNSNSAQPPQSSSAEEFYEEVETIYDKIYEEGDTGRLEALHDLQDVFNELESDRVIQGYDIIGSYNVPDRKNPADKSTSALRMMRDLRKPQFLTPAPRSGMFTKKPMEQLSILSLPDLHRPDLKKEPTISLPSLNGNPLSKSKVVQQGKKSKFVNQTIKIIGGGEKQKQRLQMKAVRFETPSETSETSDWRHPPTPPEIIKLMTKKEKSLAEAHQKVRENLEFLHIPESEQSETGTSSSPNTAVTSSGTSRGEGFTPIRKPSLPRPQTKSDEIWKSDLNIVTRIKSIPKPVTYLPGPDGNILQLKYKPPFWPHQKSLNQILDRMPFLTCLILDGSELQILRDLGSNLPSLETLSVAKCSLRSLDGTFAFPNLRTLIASGNNIQHPAQCSYLPFLNHLDLSFNPIKDIESFGPLKTCSKLRSLKLVETPISYSPEFVKRINILIPQVKELNPSVVSKLSIEQINKSKDAADLEPIEIMRLQNYMDSKIQRSTKIRIKPQTIDSSLFTLKFQSNFDKYKKKLRINEENRNLFPVESESFIRDLTESSSGNSSATTDIATDPFTITPSAQESGSAGWENLSTDDPQVQASIEELFLHKGRNHPKGDQFSREKDTSGDEIEGISDPEFWSSEEYISEPNDRPEENETTTDEIGDVPELVINSRLDNEYTDDFEEGDGDN